jgi:hypothetical protein
LKYVAGRADGGQRSRWAVIRDPLTEKELKKLNNIVSAYFDLAEVKAMSHEPMHMTDWIAQLDRLIQTFDGKLLDSAGSVSHDQAIQKAQAEYKKYQSTTMSAVEQDYLKTLKIAEKKLKNGRKIKKSERSS